MIRIGLSAGIPFRTKRTRNSRFSAKLLAAVCLLSVQLSVAAAVDFYWENPEILSTADSRFPAAASSEESKLSVLVWQEIEAVPREQRGSIWLSAAISDGNASSDWKTVSRFAGPFAYSGEVPDIHSVAINSKGTIVVAAASDLHKISVFVSENRGASFTETVLPQEDQPLIAPRIYRTSGDAFMLFATQGEEDFFTLKYTVSPDGRTWEAFRLFEPARTTANPFVPTLSPFAGGDLVVYQATHSSGSRLSYQLYSTVSADSGRTWSEPVMITEIPEGTQPYSNYHNQRPYIYAETTRLLSTGETHYGKTYLAWERTYYSSENARIYTAELDNAGRISGRIEQVSSSSGTAGYPVLFSVNGTLSMLWFDTRRGAETIYMAQRNGFLWEENAVSSGTGAAIFGQPLSTDDGRFLHLFWQQNRPDGSARITRLSPDRTAPPPSFRALSYTAGKRGTAEKVVTRVILPHDSSGIAGYSWIWTQDQTAEPPEEFMNLPSQTELTTYAEHDGEWFLKVRTLDYAGNWSAPAAIAYTRDTTPPGKPVVAMPEKDLNGSVYSNTFSVAWVAPDGEKDIAGYTYSLEYIGADPDKLRTPAKPGARIMTRGLQADYYNRDNGIYAFSVSAIDDVGNIGEPAVITLQLDKYIPFTTITSAVPHTDEFGTVQLDIYGRGFTYGGTISAIYIDKDGTAPYDRILTLDAGNYRIYGDRHIGSIELSDLDEGTYRIGLLHTARGLYLSKRILPVTETGTVKLGNYTYTYTPQWNALPHSYRCTIQLTDVLAGILLVLALAGLAASLRGIAVTAKDAAIIKKEVNALLTGDSMPFEKKAKTAELKRRGVSLKYKLIIFSSGLVLMSILIVAVPLGYLMNMTQEETLASGLEDRVHVLLESLSSSVRAYLPTQNVLELSFLPQQSQALAEARYTTITGLPSDGKNTNLDYIWATNDPDIEQKSDSKTLTFGATRLTGSTMTEILARCAELNELATAAAEEPAKGISDLTAEGISLALRTDAASVQRREEIQTITRQLTERLTADLSALSAQGSGSYPAYDRAHLDRTNTTYLFYKPVLYRQGSEQNFVRGLIIIEISTENLLAVLDEAQKNMFATTGLIALIALAIGAAFSLMLSSIIVKPIRKLAAHVNMIRDTGDKSELEGKNIVIKSRDEIGELGANVNAMTLGLVEAAVNETMLLGGKEVQRAFLPLDTADEISKVKLSVGHRESDGAQFFGYYEGAKGVSGDYFDYRQLDERHYAVIKCDVSGKGSPAALIMAEVAALFCDYFKTWTLRKNGTDLRPLVYKINDQINSRNLKGKFAAFTLGIFDSVGGDIYFCNAGDNLIHIYDASEHRKKTITLQETPAAGPLDSEIIGMGPGYQVQKLHLDPGDVLFLYTDGIEEAKRLYRDASAQPVRYKPDTGDLVRDEEDKDAVDGEEMTPERVSDIIEAVFAKGIYTLEKQLSPVAKLPEQYEFDFSTCEGTPENAVMALVSVEKIFRMYHAPDATDYDHAVVDKKVDAFMKKHFRQYDTHCAHQAEHPNPELKDEYMLYTGIKEDEQFDDLTLMAIRKK